MTEPLHVGRPNLGDETRFLERVKEMLASRRLTNNGPFVQEFEEKIAAYLGVKHCVATCNATIALEIASKALELKGEVIVPAYTFVATAHAFQWQGITPVFAEIDPATHCIDAGAIEKLITPKTSAIVGVHLWGRPCETERIEAIACRHGLRVIYDAAHAFACSHRGRMIGNFGACEVFSFHATKFINCFEGGAIATNDDLLAEKLRLMRNFGFAGFDRVIHLGVNGKMPEVCAAMGLTCLEAIDEIVAINRRNYQTYVEGLADVPGVTILPYDEREENNYQYVVVELDHAIAPLHRDELIRALHAQNVIARKYFWPGCHRMEPYRSLQPNAARHLPETERVAERVLVLPTGQAVTSETVEAVCEMIRAAFARAAGEPSRLGGAESGRR